jgi:ABC-type lipopolysaccharide export system ATPase subunit
MSEAFKCGALRKTFGRRVVLDGLNLVVGPAETIGLLGANGAIVALSSGCTDDIHLAHVAHRHLAFHQAQFSTRGLEESRS